MEIFLGQRKEGQGNREESRAECARRIRKEDHARQLTVTGSQREEALKGKNPRNGAGMENARQVKQVGTRQGLQARRIPVKREKLWQ